MCGNYGCKNCEHHRVWYSNDYWSPDEHECVIPADRMDNPDFDIDDLDLKDIMDRVWSQGEEWDEYDEQICPFYNHFIPSFEDF